MPPTVEEQARHKIRLEVAAIEVDGVCDEIAEILATYPQMPPQVVRALTQAAAELIGARLALVRAVEAAA